MASMFGKKIQVCQKVGLPDRFRPVLLEYRTVQLNNFLKKRYGKGTTVVPVWYVVLVLPYYELRMVG